MQAGKENPAELFYLAAHALSPKLASGPSPSKNTLAPGLRASQVLRSLPATAHLYGGIASARLDGKYYPYGQERPSATTNGSEKFTGYFRDSETGLDYADQRYHFPGTGRFLTPDPYIASGGPRDPGSWNRYAYVQGDPINFHDPRGLAICTIQSVEGPISFECNVSASTPADGGPMPPVQEDPTEPPPLAGGPSAPKLAAAPGDVQQKFNMAWGNAFYEVGIEECAKDFGKTTDWLQNKLANADWIYGPMLNADGSPKLNMAQAEVSGNKVTIDNVTFAGAADTIGNWWGNSVDMPITGDQQRTFVVIHELAHLAGKDGSIDANDYNNDFSKKLLTDCMGIKLK